MSTLVPTLQICSQVLILIQADSCGAIREEFVDPGSRLNPGFLGYTVRTKQRLYGTWAVFQKNYEILGGKVRNIISKTLFLLNFLTV
jgi:hypothetical protein